MNAPIEDEARARLRKAARLARTAFLENHKPADLNDREVRSWILHKTPNNKRDSYTEASPETWQQVAVILSVLHGG